MNAALRFDHAAVQLDQCFRPATDLAGARGFYEQTLGLWFVEQNNIACVFGANGTRLRITAVSEVANPGHTAFEGEGRDGRLNVCHSHPRTQLIR